MCVRTTLLGNRARVLVSVNNTEVLTILIKRSVSLFCLHIPTILISELPGYVPSCGVGEGERVALERSFYRSLRYVTVAYCIAYLRTKYQNGSCVLLCTLIIKQLLDRFNGRFAPN